MRTTTALALVAGLLLSGIADAQMINVTGVRVKGIAACSIPTGAGGLWSKASDGKPYWRNTDGSDTALTGYVPFSQSYPPTLLSPLGIEVVLQAAAGGDRFLSVDPRDGFNGAYACMAGDVSNAPGPGSDYQIGCSLNGAASPNYNPALGAWSWNWESDCDIGTGCGQSQSERYEIWSPPPGLGVAGTRWLTANGGNVDGVLMVGLVADQVSMGNPDPAHTGGGSINDAVQVIMLKGSTLIQSRDESNSASFAQQQADYPTSYHNPIVIFADAGNMGAPALEISGNRAADDGNVGLGTRISIYNLASDGSLDIGSDADNPALRHRFGTEHVKAVQSRRSAAGSCGWPDEGTITTVESDEASVPSSTVVCKDTFWHQGSAVQPHWNGLAAYDVFGDDGGYQGGNGTSNVGAGISPPWTGEGAVVAAKLDAVVQCSSCTPIMATAIEIAASFEVNGSAVLVQSGPTSVVYRTPAAGGGAGTGWSMDFAAGSSTVQPTITVTDGQHYAVHWTLTGQALSY